MKTAQFTKEELNWIPPFIRDMLAEWKEQNIQERHKYFIALQKLTGKLLVTIDDNIKLSKEERILFCGCINSRLETFYSQLNNSFPDSGERKEAENVIDRTKDILEKCGYYILNRYRSGENAWRYRDRPSESKTYAQI